MSLFEIRTKRQCTSLLFLRSSKRNNITMNSESISYNDQKKLFCYVKIAKRRLDGHWSNFHPLLFEICNTTPLPLLLAYSAIVIIVSESLHFARRNLMQLSTEWKEWYFFNIFICFSSFLITISIRFGIERIKLFTVTLPVHALQTQRQYSSQIVETDTFSLEFSGEILRFLLHTVSPLEMCLLPPQC